MSETADNLCWAGLTHPGKVRKNNEDTFLALAFDAQELRFLGKQGQASATGQDFVFAVSDGMGGEKSGEFASRIAVDKVTRLLPRSFRFRASGLNSGFVDLLGELFTAIHQELLRLGKYYTECAGMGATLSLGWVTPGMFLFGHIGDSRIYHLPKGGRLKQISDDHSYVGFLRRSGKINEREARQHPRKNVLNQALGGGHQFVDPQFGAVIYEPGDRFLLCSDGLIDGLWDARIEEYLQLPDPAKAVQTLVHESVEGSGRDNTTALVIAITE
jgi:PPM family protein phosphatase